MMPAIIEKVWTLIGEQALAVYGEGKSFRSLMAEDGDRFRGLNSLISWYLPILAFVAVFLLSQELEIRPPIDASAAGMVLFLVLVALCMLIRFRVLDPWYSRRFGEVQSQMSATGSPERVVDCFLSVAMMFLAVLAVNWLGDQMGLRLFPGGIAVLLCLFAWATTRLHIWGYLVFLALGLFIADPFTGPKGQLTTSVCLAIPAIGWLWAHVLLEAMDHADRRGQPTPDLASQVS